MSILLKANFVAFTDNQKPTGGSSKKKKKLEKKLKNKTHEGIDEGIELHFDWMMMINAII